MTEISKYMTYLLRHDGPKYGLKFNDEAYTDVKQVIEIVQKKNPQFNLEKL